ncbi:MAG: hypothetical protein IPM95_04510 [Sphingobacteriales bacterium]|nr:hypothetical protein [Sphingobacteriales bacterium]
MKKNVAHLGGIFIYSENAKALAEWYTEQLGIPFESTDTCQAYYTSYHYPDNETGKKHYTAFSILQSKHRPQLEFHAFCLNLRVYNLGELHASLQSKNIAIKAIESYPEGKFSQLTDPENNLIELWEDTAV